VSGFILPGNRVDILLTMDGPGGDRDATGGGTTVTLLQNIEILAIEQRVVAPAESKVDPNQLKSVTLLVSPRQAAMLNLAQSKGKLHLSLRNLGDSEATATDPIFARELWGKKPRQEKPPAAKAEVKPPAAPPRPARIRTLRGTSQGEVLVYPRRDLGAWELTLPSLPPSRGEVLVYPRRDAGAP
jgi:pilus assembly protein CpaB